MRHLTWLAAAVVVTVAGCSKSNYDQNATSAGSVAGDTTAKTPANAAVAAVNVADVTLGKHIGADKKVTDATDTFAPKDQIYASVHTTGTNSGKITARWTFQDGQVVDERSETISGKGDDYTEFHVSKPSGWPAGKYTLHVLVDGNEVQTKDFTVK
jgi:hypothetical protein